MPKSHEMLKVKGRLQFLYSNTDQALPPVSEAEVERVLQLNEHGLSTRYVMKLEPPIKGPNGPITEAFIPKALRNETSRNVTEKFNCQVVVYQPGFALPVVVTMELA